MTARLAHNDEETTALLNRLRDRLISHRKFVLYHQLSTMQENEKAGHEVSPLGLAREVKEIGELLEAVDLAISTR